MEQYGVRQVVLVEFALGEAGGEVGAVDRQVVLLQQVRQRAEVILVAVRQDDGQKGVAVLFEEVEVGDGHVHAVGGLFGEPHPDIDDDHLVAVTQT